MAGDEKNIGGAKIDDGIDPLAPLTHETKEGLASILAAMMFVGCEIIRLDVSAAPLPTNQYPKLRAYYIIVNTVTAGTITLTVGTAQYPITLGASALAVLPFPLLIERGMSLGAVGNDGRIFLIGKPE